MMEENKLDMYRAQAREIRIALLDMLSDLGVGHVGGCMSIVDVLTVLYYGQMKIRPGEPRWPERDRLVLSKGHAGPALYATLAQRGYFDASLLKTLNRIHTRLPSHCDRRLTPGIDMTAGSLGQGFSCAVGIAIGQRLCGYDDAFTFAILGDGESQEGQVWEAAMLAASRRLGNLIAFTDYNNMQIDGLVSEVNDIAPLADKWRAFGFHVQQIDGHDYEAIHDAIDRAKEERDKPSMIVLNTIKGKGASFCENKITSHNMPVSRDDFALALREIRGEE